MKRKLFTVFLAGVLIIGLGTAAFAASQIKVVLNGQGLAFDAEPTITNGRVMVPIRNIAEAFGAEVKWDGDTKTVYIESKDGTNSQITYLEQALAPKSPISAVNSWAEGVKMRNGAWQYAVMTPELQKKHHDEFVAMNWSTGTSSPWVKEYKASEIGNPDKNTTIYEVEFTWSDSTMSTSTTKEYVTVKNSEGTWLVSAIDQIHVRGNISTITLDDNKNVKSVFVETSKAEPGVYLEGMLIITDKTKIYKGYTNQELKSSDLKVGDLVEGTYTDGPMILIYPPQGEAETIRVF